MTTELFCLLFDIFSFLLLVYASFKIIPVFLNEYVKTKQEERNLLRAKIHLLCSLTKFDLKDVEVMGDIIDSI